MKSPSTLVILAAEVAAYPCNYCVLLGRPWPSYKEISSLIYDDQCRARALIRYSGDTRSLRRFTIVFTAPHLPLTV